MKTKPDAATAAASSMRESARSHRIRELNDEFRTALPRGGGRTVMTRGISVLDPDQVVRILERVRRYDSFDVGNDPYGEHDFGSFDDEGRRILWKVDYYDRTLAGGSPDPSDPAVTVRVLTIMLAEEY